MAGIKYKRPGAGIVRRKPRLKPGATAGPSDRVGYPTGGPLRKGKPAGIAPKFQGGISQKKINTMLKNGANQIKGVNVPQAGPAAGIRKRRKK